MRPDIVVSKGEAVGLVADCKYKGLEPSELKNHDVYQMLAYCTATKVRRGLLIYPVHAAVVQDLIGIRNTDTTIRQATIDLGKEDIEGLNHACDAFAQTVFGWLDVDAA